MLTPIPLYTIQSTLVLVGVCNSIDKTVKQFLWSRTQERRGIPLIRWEKITESKNQGGPGIKRMRNMNIAMMAKIGWRLTKEDRGRQSLD